jgi:hypothetical protein
VELKDLIAHLDAHFVAYSEESLLAMAPALEELGRNKRFLADYLEQNLNSSDFQQENPYRGSTFVLGTGEGYMIRAIAWPVKTPPRRSAEIYAGDIAHNHTFSLLTLGYLGPGYTTDLYDCPADVLSVDAPRREQLHEGRTLYYPAYRIAHTQQAPKEYSVSLNILAYDQRQADQTFFNVATGEVVRRLAAPPRI